MSSSKILRFMRPGQSFDRYYFYNEHHVSYAIGRHILLSLFLFLASSFIESIEPEPARASCMGIDPIRAPGRFKFRFPKRNMHILQG